ncbi:MAG TPA: DUF3078 domain-containing protein [Chitinophagaceae bacterium]|jgi:hypothetical protein|nr:DUF3078 domain-containing protein [Chitinophagaceae bacterium]
MKKIFTILCLAIATQSMAQADKKSDELQKDMKRKVEAKNEGWTKGGLLNIGLNQAMLENWAAGGERMSLAANGQFNGYLTRIKGNKIFENTLDLYYGLNYVASNNFVPRKLDDRIDFSSRYGLQPKNWTTSKSKLKRSTYLMGLLRFQSQFTKGYNYEDANWETNPISEFLAPAYITLALGAEYRPNDHFSVFFSPLAGRFTTVKSKYTALQAAYGVEQGKTSRLELGAYLTAKYKTNLTKNIMYNTRLDLYSNYLAKNKTMPGGYVRKDNPGNIDILWDNFFAMKISKFIGAGLGFTMIYDNDQPGLKNKTETVNGIATPAYGPLGWWQLKQVLNVGFSYKL